MKPRTRKFGECLCLFQVVTLDMLSCFDFPTRFFGEYMRKPYIIVISDPLDIIQKDFRADSRKLQSNGANLTSILPLQYFLLDRIIIKGTLQCSDSVPFDSRLLLLQFLID